MRLSNYLRLVILFSLVCTSPRAQQITIESAEQLLQDSSWSEAEIAFRQLVTEDPSNGRAWLRLGFSLHRLGKYAEAVSAYEESEDLKFAPQATRYNLARAYTRLGDTNRAIGWLEQAVDAGYPDIGSLKNDPELESIRSDSRFANILKRVDQLSRPCENDPVYSLLDFWVGEWNVVNASGETVGKNVIERILGGCAVTELWTGEAGFEGRSLFYYNNMTSRWTQVWITGRATSPGGLKEKYLVALYDDGGVRFQGVYPSATGARILDRTTLTPLSDGRVRQVIERSTDGGNTWAVGFDAYYVRSN